MTRILWLPEALDDVERLHDFLIWKEPSAAARAVRTILNGAGRLQELPELGRPLADGTDRRELVVRFGAGAYVLRYRMDREAAVIIRVWHSREARG